MVVPGWWLAGVDGRWWAGTGEATEATLTLDSLYALYRRSYRDHETPGCGAPSPFSGLPRVARVVAEFAEADAQDGKPMRSFSEFRLALAHGARALVPLGWTAT